MPTAALTISPTWSLAATGATNVLIPAIDNFRWAITTGSAPALDPEVCPFKPRGGELSLTLAAGESLYVYGYRSIATSVTTGA